MLVSASPIQSLVDVASTGAVGYLGAVAAVGAISMALIQAAKEMFPLRRAFQRARIRKWMAEGASEAQKFGRPVSADAAEQQLIHLATDEDAAAFYDLPIEQLCGQFNAAAQIALDYPDLHFDLLAVTASGSSEPDVRLLLSPPRLPADIKNMNPDMLKAKASYTDARNRIAHQVQRAIDALQISVGFQWKHRLRIASFVLSGLIAGGADILYSPAGSWSAVNILITAVLAGYLAPVARDLVAALQKLRS